MIGRVKLEFGQKVLLETHLWLDRVNPIMEQKPILLSMIISVATSTLNPTFNFNQNLTLITTKEDNCKNRENT